MKLKIFLIIISISSSALAFPTLERMQKIQTFVESLDTNHLFDHIKINYDENSPGPAISRKIKNAYEITFNPKILSTLSESAKTLISYHELGHILLGHSDMDPKLKNRVEVEFEADSFAAFLFKRLHTVNAEILSFIDFIDTQTTTTPPGNERAVLFRKILIDAIIAGPVL